MTVQELRKRTGLSQSKFAEKYGIPIGTLQNWEHGRRTPPEYVLTLLQRSLERDPAMILETIKDEIQGLPAGNGGDSDHPSAGRCIEEKLISDLLDERIAELRK